MVIVAYDGAQILDAASPAGALEIANSHGADPPYAIDLVTGRGATIRTSSGLQLAGTRRIATVTGPIDTLLVVGGAGAETAAHDETMLAQLRRLAGRSRRYGSVCTGAFVLAAAGLLDRRRVTTHWRYSALLAEAFPAVEVDPAPLYIRDGNVYTSAGVTSALDLTLALIEDDHGPALAREVARELVTYLHRPADQAQLSVFVSAPPGNRVVDDLLRHITANLGADLSPGALAARAGITTRHLSRLFGTHLGTTPAKAVRATRTEAAAHLAIGTDLPLATIARRCGLGSAATLRHAFLDRYGITGDILRKRTDIPPPRRDQGAQTAGA
ncbi:GlxA family transcriptional regulator [Amycolatopsis sp. YIM 10]|uniref:GlxA family transcriptional regulator n=1 Tax=Amycolatopsis sp. YIM 10 TaxID=2653857 RepID=UPI00128FE275|nr:DJ-1/PfpI family protein [Amycolatopsis sp. YIM 10]QFU89455.1 HTH-type transcriptional regulator CdhR [Amycolatopsis sp. YIM 10]